MRKDKVVIRVRGIPDEVYYEALLMSMKKMLQKAVKKARRKGRAKR